MSGNNPCHILLGDSRDHECPHYILSFLYCLNLDDSVDHADGNIALKDGVPGGGGRWCPTHCYPMDWSCTGVSVHGISQARILEWIAISSSRGSSWPRDLIRVSCVFCMAGRFFTHWAMGDSQRMIEQQFRRNLVPGWLWKAEMPHNTGPLISNLFHKMKSSEPL